MDAQPARRDVTCPTQTPLCRCEAGWSCVATARYVHPRPSFHSRLDPQLSDAIIRLLLAAQRQPAQPTLASRTPSCLSQAAASILASSSDRSWPCSSSPASASASGLCVRSGCVEELATALEHWLTCYMPLVLRLETCVAWRSSRRELSGFRWQSTEISFSPARALDARQRSQPTRC